MDSWRIFESMDDPDVGGGGVALSPSSVDTQIDSLLVTFEDAASEAEDDIVPEGTSMIDMLLMLEAEDEADAPNDEEEDITGDDEQKTDEPGVPLKPKVNIDEFTSRVAALIQTYVKRLDVETVIFNRAKNYLKNEHGDQAAKMFEDKLVQDHDIDLRQDVEADPEPNPQAVNAMGPSPA